MRNLSALTAVALAALFFGFPAGAQPAAAPAKEPVSAASKVTAVTVYVGNALVTREVDVPAGQGLVEIVVSPLPPQTIDSSLYSEGADGIRVLSTRYRTRAVKEDTRAEVRALQEQLKKLKADAEMLQSQEKTLDQNQLFLTKLEGFTGATMSSLTEKGVLNADSVITLARFAMQTRDESAKAKVEAHQKLQANAEQQQFVQRQMGELAAGTNRTERDAIIVVDKANNAAGKVNLNYLVSAAGWRPQYKLRAAGDKEPVQIEYLAAIEQQSGEDWPNATITLSTAQPMLNAAPPELLALDITVGGRGGKGAQQGAGQSLTLGRENYDRSQQLRQEGQVQLNRGDLYTGNTAINEAAALEQTEELLNPALMDFNKAMSPHLVAAGREGPSVIYHLKTRMTVPSRADEQLIEVARIELAPEYFYKAQPVVTSHVYRLANLTNKSEYVLLPGEATMYVGKDFVGRQKLPLVAIGEQFVAGFGVDPQLQVTRQMVNKTRSVQGANQVLTYEYRLRMSSYKSTPAKLQLWDRLPKADAESVGVSLVKTSPELSTDPQYLRDERPDNLLRWDLTIDPGMTGERAKEVGYQFKLEYAKDVSIGNFRPAPAKR
ncbi:MAG TPA: DUF4139 domain-containing protein [Tepidisphaeraceae bacterium]|nr:DUF4139 domain-containing protein [Tepidisphaeraceae bacterium]